VTLKVNLKERLQFQPRFNPHDFTNFNHYLLKRTPSQFITLFLACLFPGISYIR
jgi:hypothetical protein